MDPDCQQRLAKRIAMKMGSERVTDMIRQKCMDIWKAADTNLAAMIEKNLKEI
jgi:catalase